MVGRTRRHRFHDDKQPADPNNLQTEVRNLVTGMVIIVPRVCPREQGDQTNPTA